MSRKRMTTEAREQLFALWKSGMTVPVAAKLMGIAWCSADYWFTKWSTGSKGYQRDHVLAERNGCLHQTPYFQHWADRERKPCPPPNALPGIPLSRLMAGR